MILTVLLFILGLGLLVGGAWLLVGGGSRVAAVLGMPSVVVGLTVVAFGTSAPELFVSLMGALKGSTGLVLGNVIGSNVANLGLILALGAMARPVVVERGLVKRELPLLLVVTFLFIALVWDGVLGRWDAALLVVIFAFFMLWTIKGVRPGNAVVPRPEVEVVPAGRKLRSLSLGSVMVLFGIGGLAGGGQVIVTSALDLAGRLGVSETLVGLTIVAVGTSLPELATTIVAALRNEHDLALGNIVGSNLFNILAVAGPVGLLRPLVATEGNVLVQLVSMGLLTVLVYAMIVLGGGGLGRRQGTVLLVIYVAVMVLWTMGF